MSRLPKLVLETGWRSELACAGPFKADPLAEQATPVFSGRYLHPPAGLSATSARIACAHQLTVKRCFWRWI